MVLWVQYVVILCAQDVMVFFVQHVMVMCSRCGDYHVVCSSYGGI